MRDLQNDRSSDSAGRHRDRALHLQHLGRTQDALTAYREALARDPDNPTLLRQLAHCQMESSEERDQALVTIQRAIELDPYEATSHALHSLILSGANRSKEAVAPAERTIALAPVDPLGYAVLARSHLVSEAWVNAEDAAKQALTLDPEHGMAANVLTQALFRQGKQADNQVHLSSMLHRDPEDPYTHHSAGLAALQAGNHRQAEEHFLTALRLDANFEAAREGLLDSFRARSPLYRGYLRYVYAMLKFPAATRFKIILGMLVVVWLGSTALSQVSPLGGNLVLAFYALFVVWTYSARSVGSFIVFGDKHARQAMRSRERVEAVLVGGGVVMGMLLLGIGLLIASSMLTFCGILFAAPSVPLCLSFHNDHPKGRWLYAGLAAVIFGGMLLLPLSGLLPALKPMADVSVTVALVAFVAGPWLANFRVWFR